MDDDNFVRITPFSYVADIGDAVAFYVDLLGFKALLREGGYAYIQRGPAAIRLWEDAALAEQGSHGKVGIYIDVRDVDALHSEMAGRIADLPAPRTEPYGQREFRVRAPDGNLIVFSQTLQMSAATF